MEFQDKVLKCIDCGSDFIFTAGEQLFFHDKQFKNEPKRCKACKTKRVAVLGARPGARTALPLHQGRDPGHLLGMRKTNYRSFPSHARPPRLLPRMLPVAKDGRYRLIRSCRVNDREPGRSCAM